MTAKEGVELGHVNRIFADYEALERETMAFAYRVAFESPIVLRRGKENYLNEMDAMGLATAHDHARNPFRVTWRNDAIEGHRMRYEGKGRARSPVALRNPQDEVGGSGRAGARQRPCSDSQGRCQG